MPSNVCKDRTDSSNDSPSRRSAATNPRAHRKTHPPTIPVARPAVRVRTSGLRGAHRPNARSSVRRKSGDTATAAFPPDAAWFLPSRSQRSGRNRPLPLIYKALQQALADHQQLGERGVFDFINGYPVVFDVDNVPGGMAWDVVMFLAARLPVFGASSLRGFQNSCLLLRAIGRSPSLLSDRSTPHGAQNETGMTTWWVVMPASVMRTQSRRSGGPSR
jgi:hypothetical protein